MLYCQHGAGVAQALYARIYDRTHGGFGQAPKFPTPHNLLFLLTYYERQGDTACLDTMIKMQPERIVYVSCDSATLARDLKVLCGGGYELKKVCCVDMFGQTTHVETVCSLVHRGEQ